MLPLPEEAGVDRAGDRGDLAAGGGQARAADAPQHLRIDPLLALAARRELALLKHPFCGELLERAPGDPGRETEGLDRRGGGERALVRAPNGRAAGRPPDRLRPRCASGTPGGSATPSASRSSPASSIAATCSRPAMRTVRIRRRVVEPGELGVRDRPPPPCAVRGPRGSGARGGGAHPRSARRRAGPAPR